MARLNEPPVSTDSIETLRKKFLRQNRDIARVNSTQSLRIRVLENDCARLLSENLELRSRILELEKEAEDNSAQRIADHALQIKAQMEAQLIEWGSLLAGLGLEPPTKRHNSPRGRRIAKPRRSTGPGSARRRPRDVQDAEAAAAQEGRLPPIYENNTYPRKTMSRDEILALCSKAEDDDNESPDLGPPPTSRFVEVDPVKVDSPSRSTGAPNASPQLEDGNATVLLHPIDSAVRKLDYNKKSCVEPEKKTKSEALKLDKEMEPEPIRSTLKAGSKRKFGDENEGTRASRILSDKGKENINIAPVKPLAIKEMMNRRSTKDAVSVKRDGKDQLSSAPGLTSTRKPLGTKSTNSDLMSPKKLAKSLSLSAIKTASDPATEEFSIPPKERRVVSIPVPASRPPTPSTLDVPPEAETPSADTGESPGTPESQPSKDQVRDTPPPIDISAHGETSRPSRRAARAHVSYAEPNLRDKMRRDTKELCDAVAGEGKFHRASAAHLTAPPSATKIKHENETADLAKESCGDECVVIKEELPSQNHESPEELPSSVVTDRRKRHSSIRESLSGNMQTSSEDSKSSKGKELDRKDAQDDDNQTPDPYEFTISSPVAESKESEHHEKGRNLKGTRASSVHVRGGSSRGPGRASTKAAHSRKRASMAAPKKSSMLDDSPEDDSSEFSLHDSKEQSSTTDRISRRRSMML